MKRKGISLITLIITIIVIIILAGAVIISLNNSNIISNTNRAVLLNKIAKYKDALMLHHSNKLLANFKYDSKTLNANDIKYEANVVNPNEKTILDAITIMDKNDVKKFEVINGKLVYKTDSEKESGWVDGIIEVIPNTKKELTTVITLDANGGTYDKKQLTSNNHWIKFPDNVPKKDDGSVFAYWSPKKFSNMDEVTNAMQSNNFKDIGGYVMPFLAGYCAPISGNHTLYAVYGNKKGTIKYNYDDGTVEEQDFYTPRLKQEMPKKEGYCFAGWNTSKEGTGKTYIPGQTVQEEIQLLELYPMWIPENEAYNITYELDGGKLNSPLEKKGKIFMSDASNYPIKEGKSFIGWSTTKGGDIDVSFASTGVGTLLSSDITLYAKYQDLIHIVFNYNDGTERKEEIYGVGIMGPNIDKLESSDKNKEFIGWEYEMDGYKNGPVPVKVYVPLMEGIGLGPIINELNLYAMFGTPYTVNYYDNIDNSKPVYTEKTAYANISKRSLKKDGWRFIEWNSSPDGKGTSYANREGILIEQDTNLYAKWLRPYTVTYDANGGTNAPTSQTETDINSGIKITNEKPTRPGFTFKNWNTKPDGSGKNYDSNDSIYRLEEDITLYAMWFEIVPIENIVKEGSYISIPGTNVDWVVLYKNTHGINGIEVISKRNVKNITLGGESAEQGKTGYANMINTLNGEAESYRSANASRYASRARCVGSKLDNPSYLGNISEGLIHFYSEYNGSVITNEDLTNTHHETDYAQLQALNINNTGEYYWLASRYAYGYSSRSGFYGRCVDYSRQRLYWLLLRCEF